MDKSVLELKELMTELPDYADQFLNMICNVLRGYRDTCHNAYRGMQAILFVTLLKKKVREKIVRFFFFQCFL